MENSTNLTDDEKIPLFRTYLFYPEVPNEYEIALYVVFFILIVFGNIWVIIAVIREPRLRKTTTNWFIVSLSVSDLIVALFQVTYQFFHEFFPIEFNDVNNNIHACRTFAWFQWTARCATVFSLIGIALDRFRAIVQPLKPKINREQATAIIVIIWLSAFGYSAYRPSMYTKQVLHFPMGSMEFCVIKRSYLPIFKKFYTIDLFIMYLIPLLIIIILYSAMIGSLWFTRSINEASTRNKRRAVKMLVVVVILFAVSWFPYYWYTLYYHFNRTPPYSIQKYAYIQWHFAHTCFVSNSFVNPFLYAYFNERFRREFYRMFPCLKRFMTPRVGPDTGTSMTSQAKTNGTVISTVSQTANSTV